jgi:hypothetical protein
VARMHHIVFQTLQQPFPLWVWLLQFVCFLCNSMDVDFGWGFYNVYVFHAIAWMWTLGGVATVCTFLMQ